MPRVSAPPSAGRVLELVLRHGSDATAFQTLQAGFSYFFHGDDTCVAFADTGAAWVAAGAPIAPAEQTAEAVDAFVEAARRARKRVCFFATESALERASGEALSAIPIGQQPVWNPQRWPALLEKHRSLREQLRRAKSKGVRIRKLPPAELAQDAMCAALHRVTERWLMRRTLAPMGFLVQIEPCSTNPARHTFVAERDGRVLGFAGVVPVPTRGGWFLQDLVRDPEAPNGTGELLVHTVMTWAKEAGSAWLTLGLAPLSGALPSWLRWAKAGFGSIFDFAGLRSYKAKFRPNHWQAMYLCHPPSQPAWLTIIDALAAFATGGFLRFGARTLLRGPKLVLRVLSLLLVPWTALLMLAPSEHWFGLTFAKWAWIFFDLLLTVGLFAWLRRPSARLLSALALAVSADAVLTTVEALFWNASRVQNKLEYLVLIVACSGPSLAALLLWGARRHRRKFS